ncbi:hypothetical protein P153DRAFT_368602 [Dothidotthia symphoricarpi CBS 119687]|uniref:Small EDRK-rich factor-like N-terminal domain-containing protein n=1 Tax=Dothidotthia symphoricarpi CBS 119687 TaxID=1392245 RepID=A0A6A6A5Y1_9PLEO|nr:uncharacterized protein P153DRAFT_368602 [Dothidotthia symphoricarpi CBS 119687]KAF2127289.1 hypothetical protein P153DRAFT_368602 [Dothidotthia symphoricarpi CBS 119687]
MARGNQRDKAREKNLKEQAGKVRYFCPPQKPSVHVNRRMLADENDVVEGQEQRMC